MISDPVQCRRLGAKRWVTLGCKLVSAVLLAGVVLCGAAFHANASATNATTNARVHELAQQFRCLVCQNQSLADSNAALAADLRDTIRKQVQQGATDEQVRSYMVRRYGDFVLYRPPLKPATWMLWLGPFVMLTFGAGTLLRLVLRQRDAPARPLDVEEQRRVDAWLAADDGASQP